MVPQALKRIQRWYRAIAPQLCDAMPEVAPVQVEQGLCLWTLMAVSLPLCVDRGMITPEGAHGFWQMAGAEGDVEPRLRSLLHDLNQRYHLGFPLAHLPPTLPLTQRVLDEFRQGVAPEAVPLEWIGGLYEVLMAGGSAGARIRKVQGAYFTPPELVHSMVRQCLASLPAGEITILDPACGGGAFLLAAYTQLLQRLQTLDAAARSALLQHRIYGVDCDPLAVAVTRLSLLLKCREPGWEPSLPAPDLRHTIHCGNSLVDLDHTPGSYELAGRPWQTRLAPLARQGGFDSVVGNPPYLDAEGMTRHQPALRRYCTGRYRAARGNWDLFCVFIERALSWCKEGGWHSFVVPNKLLSVPYGGVVRSLLATENRLVQIRDYSRLSLFPASVYPITYQVQHTPADTTPIRYEWMADLNQVEQQYWVNPADFQPGDRPWSLPASPDWERAIALLQAMTPLSQWATVTDAATVAEAYAIQPLLQEACENQPGLPVVNSGTLDRYRYLWGEKRLRYLGTTYQHPVIPLRQWPQLPPQRLFQARQPKILIASMTRRLEAFLDETGGILAGKSTTVILPHTNPYWLLGLLNSQLIQTWFAHTYGGNRLQGGYLRVGPAQVRQIPIQLPVGAVGDRLTTLVKHRITLARTATATSPQVQYLDRDIDALVYQIYGLQANL